MKVRASRVKACFRNSTQPKLQKIEDFMKKQYIIPITERVFPETIMWNPGGEDGGIIKGGSAIPPTRIIV